MADTSLSGPENLHTLVSALLCVLCFQRITFFKNIFVFAYDAFLANAMFLVTRRRHHKQRHLQQESWH